MKSLFLIAVFLSIKFLFSAEEPGAKAKAFADAAKSTAEAQKINLLMVAEVRKLEADTVKAYAEAVKFISEAHLNEAKRQQIFVEMERLRQRMRITEYEFQRIVAADYQMHSEISLLEGKGNLIRSLILGKSNWKTWNALEYLMEKTGDADIIVQVMFDIKIEAFPATEFISNEFGGATEEFSGGNLGELYTFVQQRDYSFKKFGVAHKAIMKVLAMVAKSSDLRIKELRDINQSIRLTIAKID